MLQHPKSDPKHLRRDMRCVLGAEAVSNFGSMLSRLAIPWLAALNLNASPLDMAALLIADVLCAALGAALLGAAIDKRSPRAVMLAADLGRAVVLAATAASAFFGSATMAILVAASATGGLLTVVFEMARSKWLAQAVPTELLPSHNAQLSVAGSASEAAAFALGGWLYQGLGAAAALLVDAASYLGSAALVQKMRREAPPLGAGEGASPEPAPPTPVLRPWACIWQTPALRNLAVLVGLCAASSSLMATNYMIHVSRSLGYNPGALGMVFATGALGSMLGAGIAGLLQRRWGTQCALGLGLSLAAFATALVGFSPQANLGSSAAAIGLGLLVAHQVVGDAGQTIFQVHDASIRQSTAPQGAQAQIDGALRSLGHGITLLGAAAGGLVGTWLGTTQAMFAAAALLGLAAMWAFAQHGAATASPD